MFSYTHYSREAYSPHRWSMANTFCLGKNSLATSRSLKLMNKSFDRTAAKTGQNVMYKTGLHLVINECLTP